MRNVVLGAGLLISSALVLMALIRDRRTSRARADERDSDTASIDIHSPRIGDRVSASEVLERYLRSVDRLERAARKRR